MISTRFFLAFILSIATISAVYADITIDVVRHDTDLQSTYNHLKACSCGGTVDAVTIKNLGDLESYYGFTIESNNPSWFTLDRGSAWLAPGDSIDVYVFTTAPCDAVGTGTYTVYASSEYGRYRAVEKTIQVGVCENILTSITPRRSIVEPCSTQRYDLSITNVATFTETYRTDWLGFPETTILPGQTKTIFGEYRAACDEWGNRTIPVTVHSVRNGLSREVPVHIEVPRSYDFSLSLGDVPQPVCTGATTVIPVFLRNIEERANTFTLTGTGSSSLNVSVPGATTVVVDVPFVPSRVSERDFTVTAVSVNGSIEKSAGLTLPVEACFGYKVQAPSTIISCPGSVSVPFTITSSGSRPQALSLQIMSNTTTSINSLNANILPGQVITKTVEAIIPDADRQWYVTLNTSTAYRSVSETVEITGASTQTCYLAEPTNDRFTVWTDQTVLPFVITHNGIESAMYSLYYNGTYATLMETEVTLQPGESAVLHLAINATGYSTGRSVNRLILSTNGVDYVTDFDLQLRQKGFWQNFTDACRADGGFAVCSVTSALALLFLIGVILFIAAVLARMVTFENPKHRSKERWGVVGGIVLIILLALLIFTAPNIPRSYDRPVGPSNAEDLSFEIGQGQSLTLDVSSHFADADNDNLRFMANQPQHLTVRIEGNLATISADNEWAGVEYLVFTASDGRGGLTDSDLFMVSVVPYRPVTFLEYWMRACWFLTYLFLFIALAMLLMLVLFSRVPVERQAEPSSSIRDESTELTTTTSRTVTRGRAKATLMDSDEGEQRPLTILERDVMRQAQTLVNAENIIINQGAQTETVYVASAEGKRFHKLSCPVVRNMPKDKRVTFSTKEDAIKGGYSPCKTCSSAQ